jgi:Xaa-Pro aminopeptidase
MHLTAMKMAAPGLLESAIAGEIEGIALKRGGRLSFPAIVSVRGETLHNHYHGNTMQDADLLVNDSGAENSMGYAADITRTIPVSGKFSTRQREIYEIVLKANNEAIAASRPGVPYRQVHLLSARIVASGLAELGLMKGDPDAAVTAGAHALFFPHGLGHMMGLDVHDMENIGEQYVGYGEGEQRSKQFGLAYLRLARNLEPGFVLTVEPGIYFIPALIDQWQKAGQHAEFINYEKVRDYIGFGGIRIEDDIVITSDGCSVIGEPIAKDVADVEAACAAR